MDSFQYLYTCWEHNEDMYKRLFDVEKIILTNYGHLNLVILSSYVHNRIELV